MYRLLLSKKSEKKETRLSRNRCKEQIGLSLKNIMNDSTTMLDALAGMLTRGNGQGAAGIAMRHARDLVTTKNVYHAQLSA